MQNRSIFWLLALVIGIASSCQDDLDDQIRPANQLQLNDFIWRAMNIFYLDKAEVEDLADDRFASVDELNEFLSSFSSPEELFENLLTPTDRFSIIVSDYRVLEDALNGIRIDNGMRFGLVRINNTNDVFGYVRYVLPNSPADQAGIERGMIFNKLDGERFTSSTNFGALFAADSYTISLANFDGSTLTDTSTDVFLSKLEITEEAIHKTEIFESNELKIGYLMYNGFRRTQEGELNEIFGNFAAQGVNELVLDLRYNGGGDLRTSVDLSSMITGQFAGNLFANQLSNSNFEDETIAFSTQNRAGDVLNSLNLSRVYILTSPSTASASEMVISGLLPYINVVQIGTATVGKYQGSITVYDSENYGRQGATLNHTYALQPLVFKLSNANGYTDFDEGIPPTIELPEDFANLGILGEENEPLLKAALQEMGYVFGRPATPSNAPLYGELIWEDVSQTIDYQRVYSHYPFNK